VNLVPLHMLIGLVFVVALWTLAAIGLRAKVGTGLTVGAITWGAVVLVFGMVQRSLMPGDLHWVVQVVHLLAGLIAMGVAEKLAARIGAVAAQPVM
jgi:hypothetical protein